MNKKFFDFIEDLARKHPGEKFALAISGGLDSMALLHWFAATGLPGVALTVDHGLRPESAAEAAAVGKAAAKLNIAHETLHWTGAKPDAGLEAAARKARYDLMLDYCRAHNIGILMTAHQADDQIETFLMNLARGSGVYGLGGIRAVGQRDGIIIARPLLQVPRDELKKYCDDNGIEYFNDSMNSDEKFTRVKIRKNRAALREALGISDERLLLAIDNLSRARDDLESRAAFVENRWTASEFFALSTELQLKTLSRVIQSVGNLAYAPRLQSVKDLLYDMRAQTNMKRTLGHCTIRRLNDKIIIVPEGESASFRRKN
ncbi:MAG: tRNA lysidine(34) synthetase TilS [Rickettsiales bacterium]|jgi:tRNA(Ile)-lysidine synthase|nr:tRNA lysidine(34) synthetase TilS [Rickettsiales bacterium]